MKTLSLTTLILALLFANSLPIFAQISADQWSGQISYEVVRKVDPTSIRIMINGEQVKPGDPNFPGDIPDTRTFGQKTVIAGSNAKVSREGENQVIRTFVSVGGGSNAGPQTNVGRPFDEQIFIDLANQKVITLLSVGKDKEAKSYRAEAPIQRTKDWTITDQTKKIAGYTCRKATVPFRNETYTVWFTTELSMTYSPVNELTPEKGTVLLLESSREQYRATKVSKEVVAEKDVLPAGTTETVTTAQLAEIREKAVADFRQKLLMNERN
jgi:GLPGLI family protein